ADHVTADQLAADHEAADQLDALQVAADHVAADQVAAVHASPDHIESRCDCHPGTPVQAFALHDAASNDASPAAADVPATTELVICTRPAPARASRIDRASFRTAALTASGL